MYGSPGLPSVVMCHKSKVKPIMVKQTQGGVLRGVSAWADATSRTGKVAERGFALIPTQILFPLQFVCLSFVKR